MHILLHIRPFFGRKSELIFSSQISISVFMYRSMDEARREASVGRNGSDGRWTVYAPIGSRSTVHGSRLLNLRWTVDDGPNEMLDVISEVAYQWFFLLLELQSIPYFFMFFFSQNLIQ